MAATSGRSRRRRQGAGSQTESSSAAERGTGPRGISRGDGRITRGDSSISRDGGKVAITCPGCAAKYQIAEEKMEARLQCSQCQMTFTPAHHVGKTPRAARKSSTPAILIGGGAILVVIVVIIMNSGAPATPAPVRPKPPTHSTFSIMHPAADAAEAA